MNVLRVGKYRVLQHLGGGGSAEVYLAEDTVIRRKVALSPLAYRARFTEPARANERKRTGTEATA